MATRSPQRGRQSRVVSTNVAAATLESVEAGERAGHQHEREEPPRPPIPADLQPPPAAQPRQRPLHPPAVASQPGGGLHPTPGDPAPDPSSPQIRPAVAGIVGLVSVERVRPASPPTQGAKHPRDVVEQRLQHRAVIDVGRGHHDGEREAAALTRDMELGSRLARSTGLAPTWSPHAWRARSWCPRWPGTSRPGRPARAGRVHRRGAARTHPPWPTLPSAARPSMANHSQAPVWAAAATAWTCGPCTRSRRSSCEPGWCGVGRRTRGVAVEAAPAPPSPTARQIRAPQQESSS